jgi:proteasome lid subunit RPN8/RPN11
MVRITHKFIGCNEALKNEAITSYMSQMINETAKDHNERFFKICADKGQITATKHCVGDECGVIPKADCKRGEITIGWFHTHPHPGKERLSQSDILYGFDKDFSCVGFKKENKNKVLCFNYPYGMPLRKLRKSDDVFPIIESILEKGINRDCEQILE